MCVCACINYTLRELLKRDLLFVLWARVFFLLLHFLYMANSHIDCVAIIVVGRSLVCVFLFIHMFVMFKTVQRKQIDAIACVSN